MKSSLGRRSSVAGRKTGDLGDKSKSNIPVLSRSKSSASLAVPSGAYSVGRIRDLSADRLTRRETSVDRMSEYSALNTPCSSAIRPVRSMTMSSGRPSSMSSRQGDDRPLTEREWQAQAIELIYNTLCQDISGSQILQNSKSMKPMSLALFVDMSNYFIKKLDPKLRLDRMNYLTELPFILKKFAYRGKTDKALLQTVNTMHSWPHVLGILHFLAELVQTMEAFTQEGLDPLYPNKICMDVRTMDDDNELNMKFLIPLLQRMWVLSKQKKEKDLSKDVEENMPHIREVIAKSGFTNDIEREERRVADELNMLTEELDELANECDRVERELIVLNEKRVTLGVKADSDKRELDELRLRLQEELDTTGQLEKDIKYLEKEYESTEAILDNYASSEYGDLSQDSYEAYKKKKKELKENIDFEKAINFQMEESIFDEECATTDLKRECRKLFTSYNTKVEEVMNHDVSIKGALSYTQPKLGATPCNEAASVLLERILQSHRTQLAQLESQIKDSEDNSFEVSEEVKEKTDKLQQLKKLHEKSIADYEERKAELEKLLEDSLEKNSVMEAELALSQEALKKNHEEHDELNNELTRKEKMLRKYSNLCQTKLRLQLQASNIICQKFEGLVDEEELWKQQINRKLKNHVRDNTVPKGIVDNGLVELRMASLDPDLA